jgi:PAS domain S-box-containing protein
MDKDHSIHNGTGIDPAYFQQIVESSPIALGVQCNNEIIFLNKAACTLIGVTSPFEYYGRSLAEIVRPEHRELLSEVIQTLNGDEQTATVEAAVNGSDGMPVFVEIMFSPFLYDGTKAFQFALNEITKRKKMEDILLQSRHDWEDTFHAITDMITIHDKDFNIIYANRAAEKILQIPGFGEGSKCFRFYHGTVAPPDGCPSCNCLKTGEPADFEIFEPHLNMYIEIRSMPRFDKNGKLIGLIHIARDVTERKKTEEAIEQAKNDLEQRVEERTLELRTANEELTRQILERKSALEALQQNESKYKNLSRQFNTLLDGIPDNLLLLSPELKIMWANKAAASSFGIEPDKLPGQYCYSLCCSLSSACRNCPITLSFQSGKEESAEISSYDERIWDIRGIPIKDESGSVKYVIELSRNITEKVNLQADAARTRHLASIGELAAGVAHEINNPINNIINYAQILIDEFGAENRDDDVARRIMRDGERIAIIVRSLLSFARIRKEEKMIMDMQEIFADTMTLTSAQLRKDGIHLEMDIPHDELRVNVHPQQIQQVFLNIISNARYSLNQKYPESNENKSLVIRCHDIFMNGKRYASTEFTDFGTGIPSDIIDKVINPFFSTKPNRMGTGLGLSISHGIISEHDGKFLISSSEGEYTKVTVNLPLIEER